MVTSRRDAFATKLVQGIFRVALFLRYRVVVKRNGLDTLDRKRGILFLPNHPALIDPPILLTHLWPEFQMKALVLETFFQNPLFRLMLKWMRCLPVPNFGTSVNALKVKQAHEAIEQMAASLKRGEPCLVYPSGGLKNSGKEKVGGAMAAHSLVAACPDVQVVLIRTSGLWGSSFSRALCGTTPEFGALSLRIAVNLLKNFLFFSPRRKVLLEIEVNPADFPRSANRHEFNRYLESWYNRYPDGKGGRAESEPLTLIPNSIWSQAVVEPSFKSKPKLSISEATREKIFSAFKEILPNFSAPIRPEMRLFEDLGMDSLNVADLTVYLTKNYPIDDLAPEQIPTVQDVLEMAEGAAARATLKRAKLPRQLGKEPKRPPLAVSSAKILPIAFLDSCQRMQGHMACGDDLAGVLSYQMMKRPIFVLAEYFRALPDTHIAILLPASTSVFIVTLALQFAGKVPVLLNWTLGPRYLEEMVKASGVKTVLCSRRFLDRVPHVDFGSLLDQIVCLEDVRKKISLSQKIRGTFLSHCPTWLVAKLFHLHRLNPEDPCVLLFTSGTEAHPKGVPLSHSNVLASVRSSVEAMEGAVRGQDTLYSFLPPFHSFGYVCTGMLALLSGLRVAFSPNPTDTAALLEGIERWNITLFPGPPSFLARMFKIATDAQLATIHFYLSGGEKAPQELLERIANMSHSPLFIEGYGLTECSAAASMRRPSRPIKGVGTLLSQFEFLTIHPDTLQPLPEGAEGEICLRGPSVFSGYLNGNQSEFIERLGKKWYRTGDLGKMDADQIVTLSGRLKRFVKIGGEMISLGAIEEVLASELLKRGLIGSDSYSVAVCADGQASPHLVLFTPLAMETEEVNAILKRAGFSNLVKISSVKRLKALPVLATGKIDYQKLQAF